MAARAVPALPVRACSGVSEKDCEVCSTGYYDKPMAFRGENWCSDNHRKVMMGEIAPTRAEWDTMSFELMKALEIRWGGYVTRN